MASARSHANAGRLTFGWQPCRVLFDEPHLWDLLRAHWQELGAPAGQATLDPDFARFVQLEDLGLFRVWAARDGATLAGYIGWFIQPHLHYRSTLYAVEDLFLLEASYRRGLNGYRMFTTAIDALRDLGVKRCIVHEKVHFEAERGGLGRFFQRLGFRHTDNFWAKTL